MTYNSGIISIMTVTGNDNVTKRDTFLTPEIYDGTRAVMVKKDINDQNEFPIRVGYLVNRKFSPRRGLNPVQISQVELDLDVLLNERTK